VSNDGEAESGAGHCACGFGAVEAVEEVGEVGGIDAGAVVAY
jgi:hypothetical protein